MTVLKNRQITVLDLDFTTLASQTFSANQNYTIGGYTWTKVNTANETAAATLNSNGLTFTPVSATDYVTATRTLPGLFMALQQVIPGFRGDMGVRVWAYNSSINNAANFDLAVLAVDTNSTAYSYVYKRGTAAGGAGATSIINVNSVNASGNVNDLYAIGAANNVMVLEIPSITGSHWRSFRGSFSGNNWPRMEELTQHNSYTLTGTANTSGVTPQNLGVFLGAQRAGSGTSLTVRFARLRIDLLL
jgi:hypothetical protein